MSSITSTFAAAVAAEEDARIIGELTAMAAMADAPDVAAASSVSDPNWCGCKPIDGWVPLGMDEVIGATDRGYWIDTEREINFFARDANRPEGPGWDFATTLSYSRCIGRTRGSVIVDLHLSRELIVIRRSATSEVTTKPAKPEAIEALGPTTSLVLQFGALTFSVTFELQEGRWIHVEWECTTEPLDLEDAKLCSVYDKIIAALNSEEFALRDVPPQRWPTNADVRRAMLDCIKVEKDLTSDWEWLFARKQSPGWVAVDSDAYKRTSYGPGTAGEHDDNL